MVRVVALVAVAAAVLAGCGDGDDGGGSAGEVESSSASAPVESSSAVGTDTDCRLAVENWKRAAGEQRTDAVFGVPFARPGATAGPADRVEVYCSASTSRLVAGANYELAVLNAGLTVCETVPANCDRPATERQLRKVERLIARVENLP